MDSGQIFDIQRFSIHDGPGIRTTVFFAGCNLRCFWCHNPESLKKEPRLQFFPVKCIGCGACVKACARGVHSAAADGSRLIKRELCTGCGDCARECCAEALAMSSRGESAEKVIETVLRDKPFYRENGGVTFSGGEPLLQFEFLRSLLKLAKSHGLNTTVDTAGNVPFERFEELLPMVDLWLFDVKCAEEEDHIKATGAPNRLIFENLEKLCAAGANVEIRIPVVPTVNASAEGMSAICGRVKTFAAENSRVGVELLPFHRLGGGKYEALGMQYKASELEPPSKEELAAYRQIFADAKIRAKAE
ncbi:MAG: glycyl-radical enzyme activating protein [Oscillospiraceae bacterium]|nr:glycyl-radical enzyme activating protein [Oscillospiraceae bacterium]